jgi:hypothetical protein
MLIIITQIKFLIYTKHTAVNLGLQKSNGNAVAGSPGILPHSGLSGSLALPG